MRPITKKDVIDMPSALNNQVNLCDSCTYTYPECPSEKDDVIFGNGIGNDNICACNKYQPTVQPVATDTNVGNNSEIPNSSDCISRQQAIEALDFCAEYLRRVLDVVDLVGVEREKYKWGLGLIEARIVDLKELPPVQPERKRGEWVEISSINHTYKCSECGRLLVNVADGKNNVSKHYPYCHCGADMRGESE